jgi:hypothetical protein
VSSGPGTARRKCTEAAKYGLFRIFRVFRGSIHRVGTNSDYNARYGRIWDAMTGENKTHENEQDYGLKTRYDDDES